MDRKPWLDRLDVELRRRDVSARFRRRLLAEARDHAADLTEEDASMTESIMETRLGQPAEVAERAAAEYRKASWTRRHPLIVFGLLPLPLFLFTLIVMMLFMFSLEAGGRLISSTFGDVEVDLPRWAVVGMAFGFAYGMKFLPFVWMMRFFTRRWLRSGVNRIWYGVAALQTLFLAGTFVSTIQYSETPGQSMFFMDFVWFQGTLSLGLVDAVRMFVGWSQLFQIAVPVLLAWVMIRFAQRRQADVVMA